MAPTSTSYWLPPSVRPRRLPNGDKVSVHGSLIAALGHVDTGGGGVSELRRSNTQTGRFSAVTHSLTLFVFLPYLVPRLRPTANAFGAAFDKADIKHSA